MILSFATVLHYYSISDMLSISGNNMRTIVSNIMLERSKSVMINMLKFYKQITSLILDHDQIMNYPFRHMWVFEWLTVNKHWVSKMVKLIWFFYINCTCCIISAIIFVLFP